jgi:hypothetical protein
MFDGVIGLPFGRGERRFRTGAAPGCSNAVRLNRLLFPLKLVGAEAYAIDRGRSAFRSFPARISIFVSGDNHVY